MEDQKKFDTLDIFLYLWKKRKPIIIVTLLGAIISVIVSLSLPNYYKASTVLFPTTFISPSTGIMHINVNQETDPLIIGDEDDMEKMIQLLKSDYISEKIIIKHNLINHYGFSPDDPHLNSKLKRTYRGNVSFNKTSYQGVVISVIDKEPIVASNIANDISIMFDSLVNDMQKQRAVEAYNIAYKAYEKEKEHIETLEDSLDIYRQEGILSYYLEVERYSEAYGKAIANNKLNNNSKKFFEDKFDLLAKYGKEVLSLSLYIAELKENIARMHTNLLQAEQNLKNPMTHKYIISSAQTPDKKAFPHRSFIVIFSTLGAFMFIIAFILLLDFFKEIRIRIKKEKNQVAN